MGWSWWNGHRKMTGRGLHITQLYPTDGLEIQGKNAALYAIVPLQKNSKVQGFKFLSTYLHSLELLTYE
jgi:hypothetical protein